MQSRVAINVFGSSRGQVVETKERMSAEDRKKKAVKWWKTRAWMGGRGKHGNSSSGCESDDRKKQETETAPLEKVKNRDVDVCDAPQAKSSWFHNPSVGHSSSDGDDSSVASGTSSVSSILLRNKRSRKTHPTSDDQPLVTPKSNRAIRFADEEGQPVATIRFTERAEPSQRHDWVRIIVLLVAPKLKKFEFVHVYYNVKECNYMTSVLRHIRHVATHRVLADQRYVGLCRLADGGKELLNRYSIQDYKLERHEVLAAIPKGMKASELYPIAGQLLADNKRVVRVMNRSKWKTRRIKSGRSSSRYSQPLDMKELDDALPESEGRSGTRDGFVDERLIPHLVHTGVFLTPLLVNTHKQVASNSRFSVSTAIR